MNSAKFLFLVLTFIFSITALAETPFSVSAPLASATGGASVEGGSETETDVYSQLLSRLKQDAVILWLRQNLGNKASRFEKLITPKFAESYILEYKVAQRGQNKDIIELSGQLDAEALKGWVRLAETKGRGSSQIRPLLVISESLPGISLPSDNYYSQNGDSQFSQQTRLFLNQALKKLNLELSNFNGPLPSHPPRTEKEVFNFKESFSQTAGNAVIWVYLNQCKTCELPRTDIYLYSSSQPGVIGILSEELTASLKQLENPEKTRSALEPLFKQFQQELERVIASGKLDSIPLTVTIEGIDNYLIYRKIDQALGKQGFLSDWIPRVFVQNTAQFDALSSLGAEEVAQRIQQVGPPDFKLALVRVDSRNLVMRYSK